MMEHDRESGEGPSQNPLKRKSSWRRCSVAHCDSGSNHHLYTFPQLKESTFSRCMMWVKNTGNKDLLNVCPTKLNQHYFICEHHFDDDQYVCPTKRQRVKRNAVPMLKCPRALSANELATYVCTRIPQFKELDGPHKQNCHAVEHDRNDLHPDNVMREVDNEAGVNDVGFDANNNEDLSKVTCAEEIPALYIDGSDGPVSIPIAVVSEEVVLDTIIEDHFVCHDNVVNDHSYIHQSNYHLQPVDVDDEENDESDKNVIDHMFGTNVVFCDEEFRRSDEVLNDGIEEVVVDYNEIMSRSVDQRVKRRCCVNGCRSNNTSQTLFAFPRVERLVEGTLMVDNTLLKRCQDWVKFCANEKVMSTNLVHLHKKFYICAGHFHADDMCGRRKLKVNAVPSVLCSDEPQEMCRVENNDELEDNFMLHNNERDATGRLYDKLEDVKSKRSRKFSQNFEKLMRLSSCVVCPICKEKYFKYPGMKRVHRNKNQCWKYSDRNNMDPGEVPLVLKELTFIEEQLIARIHPVLSVYKLKGCQYGYRGNVINFSQDIQDFACKLPHRIEDLTSIITVKFENNRGTSCDFRVRAGKVRAALEWLQQNNDYYRDIYISDENLASLPEDADVFESLTSFSFPGTEEDINEDEIEDQSRNSEVKSSGVPCTSFVNQNDQVNVVLNWPQMGNEPISESTPGFIMCAFPALFPFGLCDLKDPREFEIKMHDYFKHFLCYGDERFAKHPTFRFFAFNMWLRHSALTNGNVFMRKDTNVANMNVEQLKEHLAQNPGYLKKLMFMGSNIRGSRAYWKSRCGELRDMVEQLGLPTVFLTMSAADLYWPDLYRLLAGKDISLISMTERRKLLMDNPLIVDMFFQYRLQCFVENVLEPKYRVTDYWYRIEYQHRGSPHVHGLFWFKDAPDISKYHDGTEEEKKKVLNYFDNLVCAVDPEKDCAMPDKHPCEKSSENVDNVQTDLAQLLKTVQRHTRCSPDYCQRVDKKTKKTVCRFHFPVAVEDFSRINVDADTAELEFVPERNDERLNKFNPFIISTWRANIDIAPVLSKKAIIQYLAKYVSKSETQSKTLKDICKIVCDSLSGADRAKRAIQKILIKNCVERDISAQEVCHILMGLKLYNAGGRNFVVVYTNTTDWIPVPLANNEVGDHGENVDNNSTGKCFMEKYVDRPEHLKAVSMWDAAKYYNAKSWKKCKKPNIVRVFPRLHIGEDEEKNEAYYRQRVLLFVPWTIESEIRQGNEKWRDVYDRCNVAQSTMSEVNINVNGRSDVVEEYEDIELELVQERNEDWMIASRISARGEVEQIELGRRETDLQYDWHTNSKKYESYGDLKYFSTFIETEKKKDVGSVAASDLPNVTFSPEQEGVKQMMEQQMEAIRTGVHEMVSKRVLVQGKAGTGKSLLIKFLCEKLRLDYGPDSFLLLGPTGVSAINIGGSTIHSALKLPTKMKNFKQLKGESSRVFCNLIEKVHFIIIDEYSMIGCTLLGMIDMRLREGTGVNEPFGGKFVYFFGDYKQLPPVRDAALYGGQCNSDVAQHGRNVFNSFQSHFVLKKGHRQKDVKFQELLDRLSVGEVTIDDYNILKQRFTINVSRQVQESFNDAIRLFATSDEVECYNLHKLHNLKDDAGNFVPIARIPAKHNGKRAAQGSIDQAEGLASVLYMARGTRIMLRSNLWVKMGLVNGSMGTVVDLLYEDSKQPPNDAPSILMCKFDNYLGPGIGPDKLVPIYGIVRSWSSPNGVQCTRQQFPVVVCYGCSIHKSQGLTLDQAMIDIGIKEFALGLSYVGVSRVKSLSGLLLKPFSYERLKVIKLHKQMLLRNQFENVLQQNL